MVNRMTSVELVCTSVSPDRHVALFRCQGSSEDVFAYLPHVVGLNPFLLETGDRIEGEIVQRNGRMELIQAAAQMERRRG